MTNKDEKEEKKERETSVPRYRKPANSFASREAERLETELNGGVGVRR